MDAFDIRMQTFGGQSADKKNKNFDKFIQEKRGFIRMSNGYYNNNPYKIVESETNQRVKLPGPAFETNYDNKYNEKTVFANDKGRFKQSLNTNKQSQSVLKRAERA